MRRARTRPHQSRALVREAQPDAPAVIGRAHALEEAGPLEPVDMAGERGRRDALLRGELGEREPRAPLHEPQERRLAGGHSELLGLLAELAREAEQHRPQLGRDLLTTKSNLANH